MLRAGKLRDRVQIYINSPTRSPSGQQIDNWVPVGGPIWADVQQIGGREQLRAGREVTPGEYSIRIRFREGISPQHRVMLLPDGPMLEIGVPQLDRHAGWITLTTSAVPK